MGRGNRLTERRALRRAADQALLTSLGSVVPGPTGGAADQDFEYTRYAPVEVSAPVDHEPVTEPIPVAGVADLSDDWSDPEVPAEPVGGYDPGDYPDAHIVEERIAEPADPYRWDERDEVPPPAPVQPPRPKPDLGYSPAALDFMVSTHRGQTWYRTKPAAAAIVALAVIALVSGGWLLVRSPAMAVEESITEASTSAAPTPSTAPPTAVSAAKPPSAPASPPPPPDQRTYSPPQRQYSPRYSEPTTARKPRVDVTRAPMSVAPVPKPVPGSDSNTPGDAPDRDSGGRRRGCFGFC